MAVDILLYDTDEVPVGEDQRQHVELARDLAIRFNTRYGHAFTVPRAVNPPVASRIMDLSAPTQKMSKSTSSAAGALRLLDEPTVLRRKVMRAVTDAATTMVYDPGRAPGVANLLDILAGCTGEQPQHLAAQFDRYSGLKQAVADAVVATLAPIRQRYLALTAEPEHIQSVLRAGAKRAQQQASDKVGQAKSAIGLLPA
jgi:tryptophanyl-tRNA synthetase